MVAKLFRDHPPEESSALLDPGCGPGAFIDGVLRWCAKNRAPIPRIVGIESDPRHVVEARAGFQAIPQVQIWEQDFLRPSADRFDYIVGNPPYVPITALSPVERAEDRIGFRSARGRFDLYILFFEQALSSLKPKGRLVFITPEKYLYVATAGPLRELLAGFAVEELHFLNEETFEGLVTYPLVTTLEAGKPAGLTRIVDRSATDRSVRLPGNQASWMPLIQGTKPGMVSQTLADVCSKISCGVATGSDEVFVIRNAHLDDQLRPFAQPTISGRQIVRGAALRPLHSLLVPYDRAGLIPEVKVSVRASWKG